MKITLVDIDELKPYENNPRLNDNAVGNVAWSLKEYGWQQPIVVDADHVIIAGHTRWLAAKELGMEQVPITIADDLSKDQVRAYRVADNKLHELSKWNDDLLSSELAALDMADVDLESMGFSKNDLTKLLDGDDGGDDGIDIDSMWQVIITCDSDQSQEDIYNKCQELGWECKVLTL